MPTLPLVLWLSLLLAACVPALDDDTVPDDDTCSDCPVDEDGDGADSLTDCDDTDPSIFPGAGEPCICDAVDQDCTGNTIDFDCDLACPDGQDMDGDGFASNMDCDDADPSIYPGAGEPCVCDDIDQDCTGDTRDFPCDLACEEEVDRDGDGAVAGFDCDDEDPSIYPGAEELCLCDSVDQDCSGDPLDFDCFLFCDETADLDGDGSPVTEDCDDNDASVYPGNVEPCACDAIDQDCSGVVDDFPCDMLCSYRQEGETCPGEGGVACEPGLVCCYPCGVPDCENICMVPCTDPWCAGGCPLYP